MSEMRAQLVQARVQPDLHQVQDSAGRLLPHPGDRDLQAGQRAVDSWSRVQLCAQAGQPHPARHQRRVLELRVRDDREECCG